MNEPPPTHFFVKKRLAETIKNALFNLRMVYVNAATFHQCFWFQFLALIIQSHFYFIFLELIIQNETV